MLLELTTADLTSKCDANYLQSTLHSNDVKWQPVNRLPVLKLGAG